MHRPTCSLYGIYSAVVHSILQILTALRTYFTRRLSQHGPVLATVQLSNNNLLPVDFAAPTKTSSLCSTQMQPLQPRPITRPVKSLIAHPHHTAEQLPRDHEDDALHYDRNHPSDDSLCADLSHGEIS